MTEREAIDKITHCLDLGRREQEIVAEVISGVVRLERENAKDHLNFAADERDRTILLSSLLERAREYVTDALDAMRHTDGAELLAEIDAAIATGGDHE